jgi:gamma-glutamyltranspeptidase / glutathione hydrolase
VPYSHAMHRIAIAGPSGLVTKSASLVAEEGGSVVDVAIVAALVAMCSDPGVCAPGGGGYLTIDVPGSPSAVIDGYMAFPGLGFRGEPFTREITMEYGGGVTTLVDAGSVAVPGAFAAFATASERYGSMPWRYLMEAVAGAVEHGFPLSQTAHTYLLDSGEPIFSQDPVTRETLFPDGTLLQQGDSVLFVDLAPTLRSIGEEGVDLLYGGDLGSAIVDDLEERGGRLTLRDLESYRAESRAPLEAEISSWRIGTNPPPAVGGAALMYALSAIAAADDPLDSVVWHMALRQAFETRAELLEAGGDRESSTWEMLRVAGLRSPSTISVSVVDVDGGAVAASFSAGYGSGVIPKGTGMLMNNSVGEIELLPGGLEAQRPGERMLSNMAPTVARGSDRVLAIGSPGADRITSALTVTLARAILGGDDLAAAIDHPRVHPEFTDAGIRVAAEPGIGLRGLKADVRRYDECHMYFGGVVGAALEGSELLGYADPRRVGSVALV